jgi:hypothetical protein
MGRAILFACVLWKQELCHAMDGEGSDCIEEGLQNGRRKVSIRGSMKEKGAGFSWEVICSSQTT